MIPAKTLNNELTRKLQRLDSEYGKMLSVQKKDALLNEAKDLVFENFVIRPESNALVREHLRQLEIKGKELKLTDKDEFVLAKIPEDHYRLLRLVATASSGCKETRKLEVHVITSDRTTNALSSPNWTPSYEWEETVADEGSEGYLIWHLNKFKIEKVQADYIQRLPDIYTPSLLCQDCGPYIAPSGEQISADRNFKIDSTTLWRKVVDVAELMARRDLGDAQAYQTGIDKIFRLETAYRET